MLQKQNLMQTRHFVKCLNLSELETPNIFFLEAEFYYFDNYLYFYFISGPSCLDYGIRLSKSS